MMTITKEILSHSDFSNGFINELCSVLEDAIDEEFEKENDTDFDFIDECAQAINELRSGNAANILPIISRKKFFNKLGLKKEGKLKIAVAVCAAVAVAFAAGTLIKTENNISVVEALSGIVSQLMGEKQNIRPPEDEYRTAVNSETETSEIISIEIQAREDFKTEYIVGEKFNEKGLIVFAYYSNGERRIIDDFSVKVSSDFAKNVCYETVTVSVGEFSDSIDVRIIESITSKKLTSIYAVFPDDYAFTVKNADNIDLSKMQVFALYSDGSKKELTNEEYSISFENKRSLLKRSVTVDISYEGCSCSFVVYEE